MQNKAFLCFGDFKAHVSVALSKAGFRLKRGDVAAIAAPLASLAFASPAPFDDGHLFDFALDLGIERSARAPGLAEMSGGAPAKRRRKRAAVTGGCGWFDAPLAEAAATSSSPSEVLAAGRVIVVGAGGRVLVDRRARRGLVDSAAIEAAARRVAANLPTGPLDAHLDAFHMQLAHIAAADDGFSLVEHLFDHPLFWGRLSSASRDLVATLGMSWLSTIASVPVDPAAPLFRLFQTLDREWEQDGRVRYLTITSVGEHASTFSGDNWLMLAAAALTRFGRGVQKYSVVVRRFEPTFDRYSGLPEKTICGLMIDGLEAFPLPAESMRNAHSFNPSTGKRVIQTSDICFAAAWDVCPGFAAEFWGADDQAMVHIPKLGPDSPVGRPPPDVG